MIRLRATFDDETDKTAARECIRAVAVVCAMNQEEVVFDDAETAKLGALYVRFLGNAAMALLSIADPAAPSDEKPRYVVRVGGAIREPLDQDAEIAARTIDVWSTLQSTKVRFKKPVVTLNDGTTEVIADDDPRQPWASDVVFFPLVDRLLFP